MRVDLSRQQFGRWTVLAFAGNNKSGNGTWLCRCECGTEKAVIGGHLRKGFSSSCGCLLVELNKASAKDHPQERRIYAGAQRRCTDPHSPYYASGIEFRFKSFEEFFAELGPRPAGVDAKGKALFSVDRFPNPAGHYEVGNVRWATWSQQNSNKVVPQSIVTTAMWRRGKLKGKTKSASSRDKISRAMRQHFLDVKNTARSA